jgi:CheY-like chemotaxis protein
LAGAGEKPQGGGVIANESGGVPLEAQKMEVIGRLASAMIHDLNNLLTVIQLNASLIESGGFEPDEIPAAAGKISEASQRAADLTRKVLGFARRQSEEAQALTMADLLDGLVRLLEPLVAKRVEIEIVGGGEDCWVRGDRNAIEQAVLNLVLNAVDAMPTGGTVTLGCRSRTLAEGEMAGCAAGEYAVVSVKDTGCGISPQDRERVFDPFFTSKATGTGMGLSIVRRVASSLHGAASFESEPGRGTEFFLWIPRVAPPALPVAAAAGSAAAKALEGTVLLVEDDPGIRALAQQLLEVNGLEVLSAATGEDALALWKDHGPEINLLFTDLVLPGSLTGRDVAVKILAERPDLPVLYTSGFSSAWSDRSFFNETNFLPKPFHPAELRRAIAVALHPS